ncbi:MAG: hypothetical protein QNJ51_16730 [Calothrix sp. MO_167.B12]|nr:hypothetical protein [Calothrix sp. MO_167.B12]
MKQSNKCRRVNGNKKLEEQSKSKAPTNYPFISWKLIQRILVVLTLLKTVIELVFMFPELGLDVSSDKFKKLPPITTSPNPRQAHTECPSAAKSSATSVF